jgi:hypothetical protein
MTDTTRRRRNRITDPALARLSVVATALGEMDERERTSALCWLLNRFGYGFKPGAFVDEVDTEDDDPESGDEPQPSLIDNPDDPSVQ